MKGLRVELIGGLLSIAVPTAVLAQGYQLRLDGQVQSVSFRGVRLDSVLATQTVTGPTGGPVTTDGFAVSCPVGNAYCLFYRPGPVRRSAPLVTSADLTLWGLGLSGLSLRLNSRIAADLGETSTWPGTDPAVQLLEGYARFSRGLFDLRAGRQIAANRLDYTGFDGARLAFQDRTGRLEAIGYGGLGLARGSALPINSDVLNPLDDYQLAQRQVVAGGALGWTDRYFDARLDYQRQVDRRTRQFVSERGAISGTIHPFRHWSLTGGAEYDFGNGWWGTSDLTLRYASPIVAATAGWRRYRPQFDLWTIWGAFSPVPYQAVSGTASVNPYHGLTLRARGERYRYDDAEVTTPLVDVEDRGWRFGAGLTYTPMPEWTLDIGYHAERGTGAASRGWDGALTWAPREQLDLTLHGTEQTRPLEFRFDDASLRAVGLDAEYRVNERLRFALTAARYFEDRKRPDAGAFDWNQTRIGARVTLLLSTNSDQMPLPRAVRRRPGGGAGR